MVKATRGDVARILLGHDAVRRPRTWRQLVRAAGHTVELSGSGRLTCICDIKDPAGPGR